MLHNSLIQYLLRLEQAIRRLQDVYVEKYEEDIFAEDRLTIRIRIRFFKGCLLELNEAVAVESERIKHIGYRYHFQDTGDKLIFRYDDTPHFQKLNTFPHHKHLPGEVVASNKPDIITVIEEANFIV